MRKLFSVLLFLAVSGGAAYAQDLITKKNGEDIQGKILEVNPNDIKYKRWDNLDGPTFTLPKSDILIVRYENGTNEVFTTQAVNVSEAAASGDIKIGMKYRDYKKFYDPKSYTRLPGDRYSPGGSGVCSWLIPGLGQMICGEVGRGFGYLGGSVACGIAFAVGTPLYEYAETDAGEIIGRLLQILAPAALLAVDICAIVDGVRVAKVKNMYERDVRSMVSSVSVNIEPYVATTYGMNGNIAAGASLKIRF